MAQKQYKVITEDYKLVDVLDENGQSIDYSDGRILSLEMHTKYGPKSYLYIMDMLDDFEGKFIYKIGVSNDPDRRERELDAMLIHWIECPIETVYKWEKRIHTSLKLMGVHHEKEFFFLMEHPAIDLLEGLRQIKDFREINETLYRLARYSHRTRFHKVR